VIAQALDVIGGGDGDLFRSQPAVAGSQCARVHAGQLEGTISSPSMATIQRMGRMKRGPLLPVQYIVLGK